MSQQTEAELRAEIARLNQVVEATKRLRLVTAQAALDEMDYRLNETITAIRLSKKRLVALRSHVTKQQRLELDLIISELPGEI